MACLMLVTTVGTCVSAYKEQNAKIKNNTDSPTFKKVVIGKIIGTYPVSGGHFRFDVTIRVGYDEFSCQSGPFGIFKLTIDTLKSDAGSVWLKISSCRADSPYIYRPLAMSPTNGVRLLFPVLSGL